MKKTLIALVLLGSSAAFAQSANYSTATFNWQKSVGTATPSMATHNVVLTQAVDGVLSASGGVTFSAGTVPTVYSAADARTAYANFANGVFDLVKVNRTAVADAVTAYNTASTNLGAVAIGAETLTISSVGVSGTLNGTNNATLYGARSAVQSALNTLHTNIGTANTALTSARSAIASESNIAISGAAAWTAITSNLASTPDGYYRVVQADNSYSYYRKIGTAIHQANMSESASWTTIGVVNAPVAQFQQHARQF